MRRHPHLTLCTRAPGHTHFVKFETSRATCCDVVSCAVPPGRMHFVKFETSRVEDAVAFIEAKGLHRYCGKNGQQEVRVLATGGHCGGQQWGWMGGEGAGDAAGGGVCRGCRCR